ncbi:MAG: hypothetical protein V3W41_01475 [Planctomycetota bacterium]
MQQQFDLMFQPGNGLLFAFDRLSELLQFGPVLLTLLLNALSLLREQPLKPFVFFLQFRCVHENINLRNSKRFHADSNFPKHLQKKSSASLAGGEACFEFEMEIAIEF